MNNKIKVVLEVDMQTAIEIIHYRIARRDKSIDETLSFLLENAKQNKSLKMLNKK